MARAGAVAPGGVLSEEERPPVWVTAEMASVHLQWSGYPVSPATVRQWAHRGHILAKGPRGARYNLWDVQAWAKKRAADEPST